MKAGATRDVNAKPSMTTPIASSVAEAILPVMQYVGIQKLEAKICEAANLKKISGEVTFFNGTPEEMVNFANLIKDPLAEIIAASGLTHVEIDAEPDEIAKLVESYDQLQAMYTAAKISSEDSVQPAIPSIPSVNKKKYSRRKSRCKVQ